MVYVINVKWWGWL